MATGGFMVQDEANNRNRSYMVPVAGGGTPASDNSTLLSLNRLDIQSDDAGSQRPIRKKGRVSRAIGGDKSDRGLRQFSTKVSEKVKSKGRTTYIEVADELVTEFSQSSHNMAPEQQQYDIKNIRRRVYDVLNVLNAMDIISKDRSHIHWKGLPRDSKKEIEELEMERLELIRSSIENKTTYLKELEKQFIGAQNLIQRNEQLYGSEKNPGGNVELPFILLQTRPHATVEVEISEDMQLVHFDLNSTPFELHDHNDVLKSMKLCDDEVLLPNSSDEGGVGSSTQSPTCSKLKQAQRGFQPIYIYKQNPKVRFWGFENLNCLRLIEFKAGDMNLSLESSSPPVSISACAYFLNIIPFLGKHRKLSSYVRFNNQALAQREIEKKKILS